MTVPTLNLGSPVKAGHPLNLSRAAWYPGVPGLPGATKLRNVVTGNRYEIDLTVRPTPRPTGRGNEIGYLFNGSTQYGTFATDFSAFGTGDYTVVMWLKPAVTTEQIALGHDVSGTRMWNFWTGINAAGTPTANHLSWIDQAATGSNSVGAGAVMAVGRWDRVGVARVGNSTRIFHNGVRKGTTTAGATNYTSGSGINLGRRAFSGFNQYFNGEISDPSITVGRGWSDDDFAMDYRAAMSNYRGDNSPLNFLRSWSFGASVTPPAGNRRCRVLITAGGR